MLSQLKRDTKPFSCALQSPSGIFLKILYTQLDLILSALKSLKEARHERRE
jgi:hypothetical protein